MFQWAKGLTIATLSDWYIPAKNELNILLCNLAPLVTNDTNFQYNGSEEFSTAGGYWSATENSSDPVRAWSQDVTTLGQYGNPGKANTFKARAVRRVAA
jgi:hypothetical protein